LEKLPESKNKALYIMSGDILIVVLKDIDEFSNMLEDRK